MTGALCICQLVRDLADPVKGSVEVPCCECGESVWMSPATAARAGREKAAIACCTCAAKLLEGEFEVDDLDEAEIEETRAEGLHLDGIDIDAIAEELLGE